MSQQQAASTSSSTSTSTQQQLNTVLNYNNLPPDHILNIKQRSNFSIKQVTSTTANTNTTNNTNNIKQSSPSPNNITNMNHGGNMTTSTIGGGNTSPPLLSSSNITLMNNSIHGGNSQLLSPPQIMGGENQSEFIIPSSNNSQHVLSSSNNYQVSNSNTVGSQISNNNELTLTNRTQFLLDSSSLSTTPLSDSSITIRMGNPKQIEMEITKSDIKHFQNACIHDLDSLQRFWSECYRIESEHIDKPLLYIPITGSIKLQLKLKSSPPSLALLLERKYDFRQNNHDLNSLLYPLKFDASSISYNGEYGGGAGGQLSSGSGGGAGGDTIVVLLKLMKMDYVEFIGVQSVDCYVVKSNKTIQQQQQP